MLFCHSGPDPGSILFRCLGMPASEGVDILIRPWFAFRILFTTKDTKSTKRVENKIDPSCPFVVKSVRFLSVANLRVDCGGGEKSRGGRKKWQKRIPVSMSSTNG